MTKNNKLKKNLVNNLEFWDGDSNKFVLLLGKIAYPYKSMESLKKHFKHWDINFVTDDKTRNCLESESNYHATKRF